MRKKCRIFFALFLLLAVISAAGCGKEAGKTASKTEDKTPVEAEDKFSGKWVDVKFSPDGSEWYDDSRFCIRIYKNGDSYIYERKDGAFPAISNDGRLIVNADMDKVVFTYEDKTGNLIKVFNGQHKTIYIRAKESTDNEKKK